MWFEDFDCHISGDVVICGEVDVGCPAGTDTVREGVSVCNYSIFHSCVAPSCDLLSSADGVVGTDLGVDFIIGFVSCGGWVWFGALVSSFTIEICGRRGLGLYGIALCGVDKVYYTSGILHK